MKEDEERRLAEEAEQNAARLAEEAEQLRQRQQFNKGLHRLRQEISRQTRISWLKTDLDSSLNSKTDSSIIKTSCLFFPFQ